MVGPETMVLSLQNGLGNVERIQTLLGEHTGGVLCGIAGAYLATALQAGFVKDMTAGRGFIALAALIFAKWRPWYALYACLLFGFLQALALRSDVLEAVIGFRIQVQLLDVMPYILTVIILAGFVGKAIPPRAGGEPYVKER